MINSINSTPSFGSTFIPMKDMLLHKALGNLDDYFRIRWVDFKPVQKAADEIDFNEVAMMINKDGMTLVGKDGGLGGADTFIGRIMKKIHPDAKFTDDIKPCKIEGPVIDLEI